MPNDIPAAIRQIRGQAPLPNPGGMPPVIPPPTAPQLIQASSIQFPGVDPPAIMLDNAQLLNNLNAALVPPPVQNQPQYAGFRFGGGGGGMPTKIVFRYGIQGYELTELWFASGGVGDVTATICANYLNLRMQFSGTDTVVRGVRLSTVGTRGAVVKYSVGELQAAVPIGLSFLRGVFTEDPNTGTNDPATCLDSDCTAGVAPNLRHRVLFLRGIPDGVTQHGGQYTPVGTFAAKLQAWVAFVIARNWGWLGQPIVPAPVNITNMTNVDGVLVVTTTGTPFGAGPWPFNASVSISKLPSPFQVFNGAWTVQPTANNICQFIRRMPFAVGAFPGGVGKLRNTTLTPTSAFYTLSALTITGAGERKAGKPIGLHPGRRPNRKWS